jgi:hypothetical protein
MFIPPPTRIEFNLPRNKKKLSPWVVRKVRFLTHIQLKAPIKRKQTLYLALFRHFNF